MTVTKPVNGGSEHGGTDLGRRIAERRRQVGLSREEAAARAGMATRYLEYLETSPAPSPTPSGLARLAAALGTSTSALAGAGLDLPPGRQPALDHPILAPLTAAQCREYLGPGGVGRFLFVEARGPVAVPVNYATLGDDIVIRTGERTSVASGAGQSRVSFEVDHLDEALAEGWSVLVSGEAHVVTAPAELAAVSSLGIAPWAGDDRDTYIRIVASDLTGRRIRGEEAAMAGTVSGILVGYDGSPGSEQALRWAAREARSRGTALTLCLAWAPGFPVLPGENAVVELARRGGERVMAEGLRLARGLLGSENVHALLAEGSAAAALCERSADADLAVVGSRGHGVTASVLLGSVSSQVAAHAHGRVVVVRGHWRPAGGYEPGPVVVGVDGSAASSAALDFALEEAALRDAPLLAVCALADAPGGLGGAHQIRDAFEQAILRREKEHSEVTIVRRIAHGAARHELLTAAHDAQMLVVGSRGRGGIQGMRLGSVSRAVLDHARCPVGVVHLR